jgi:hypothetical protein
MAGDGGDRDRLRTRKNLPLLAEQAELFEYRPR